MVAAGTLDALAAFAAAPPAKARVITLQVAGAFHTEHMAPAVAELRAAADGVHARRADGAAAHQLRRLGDGVRCTGARARSSRRWPTRSAGTCARPRCSGSGSPALLEVAPGGVLTGLARRTLPGVETVAVKTPADLDAARDLIRRHAGSPAPPKQPGEPVVTRPTLTQATGPAHTRILGLGGVRGENVVTNDDIAGPDRLLRRVDPAAHRASSRAAAHRRAPTCSTSPRRPRTSRSRTPA